MPRRIDDAGIASLLTPGDIIDVVGTDQRGATSLIATGVRVTSVPTPGSSWSGDDGGLVVVAAEPTTALAIAGASARGSVTVTIHP
jgi:pilus assembly protein CpaB